MSKVLLNNPIDRSFRYEKKVPKGSRIPIVSDVMFSCMFNNVKRKKYVCYLLSLVLKIDYKEIYDNIEFVKAEMDRKNVNQSKKTVDLVCKFDGKIYNIEMNNMTSTIVLERNIEYTGELFRSNMVVGHEYDYQYVIQININNFSFEGHNEAIEEFYLRDEEGVILTDKIEIIYIYLPNIRKKYYNGDKLTGLEALLLSFNEEDSSELDKLMEDNKIMKEYREESLEASQDDQIIGLYDKELYDDMIKQHELKEARESGIEQGIECGIEQGARTRDYEIAKEMKKFSEPIEKICKYTGLSEAEIEKL